MATIEEDMQRTALHCVGAVWIYGDSLRESFIFSLLQDTPHWLDEVRRSRPSALRRKAADFVQAVVVFRKYHGLNGCSGR